MDGTEPVPPERFIADARAALTESSRQHVEDWRLGSEARWEVDLKEGQVGFHFHDGTVLVAPIQIVGTYNARDATFLWAWGHRTLPEALVEHARLARRWGETNGVSDYTKAIVSCAADEVWNFAAVTARLSGRDGIYRGRSGSVWMYLTYGEFDLQVPHRTSRALATTSTALVPVSTQRLPARLQRSLVRLRADVGLVVEDRLQRLGARISDVVQRPVDCMRVTSWLRLNLARRRGQLEPLTLMAPLPSADPGEAELNTVFVPPYYAEQKRRIDHLILGGLVRHGVGDPAYAAIPDFAGRSLVPASIQIEVSGPVNCRTVMRIWDPDDEPDDDDDEDEDEDEDAEDTGRGPDTAPDRVAGHDDGPQGSDDPVTLALVTGPPTAAKSSKKPTRKSATKSNTKRNSRPMLAARSHRDELVTLSDARQPQSIVEAFIRDYFDWNAEAAQSDDRLDDDRGGAADRREQIHREYRELLQRYCAADIGPGNIAWGGESIFDPVHSRIVAEVHIGDRALVVVGRPVAAGSGQFSTYDFEFLRDEDRWWLVDIAVVDGFDRLSMLKRRRARVH